MSKIIAITIIFALCLFASRAANSPIYACTYSLIPVQVIVWGGSSILQAHNTSLDFYYPFPTGAIYSSNYDRYIILSGIKAPLTDTIDFVLTIDNYNSDTSANIRVEVGLMNVFTISTHVLFVNSTCDWLWTFSRGKSITYLVHDYAVLNNKDGGVDI
jgi:hypothetical protein